MNRKWKLVFIVPLAILGIVLFAFIGGELVLHLWNWLLPSLFGFRQITFWQGLGLLALCRILFSGFGHGPGRSRFRRRMGGRFDHMTLKSGNDSASAWANALAAVQSPPTLHSEGVSTGEAWRTAPGDSF